MKRSLLILGSVLIALILVVGIVGCAAPAPVEVIKWRYHTEYGPADTTEVYFTKYFMDPINQKTNGRLVIEPHWLKELGYERGELLSVMDQGLLEMSLLGIGAMTYEYAWLGCEMLPYIMNKPEDKWDMVQALDPLAQALCADYQTKILAHGGMGSTYLSVWSNKKLMTVDDWKGMKVRTYVDQHGELFQKLGASPIHIAMPEVYLAMQKGTMDAIATGFAPVVVEGLHWDEVTEYTLLTWPHCSHTIWVVADDAFNSLPEDIQQIVMDCANDLEKHLWDEIQMDPRGLEKMQELCEGVGQEVYFASDELDAAMRASAEEVWAEWLVKVSEMGPEGEQAFHALQKAMGRE